MAFAEQAPAQHFFPNPHFLSRPSWLHTIQIHTLLGCSRSHYRNCRIFWEEKPIACVSGVQLPANGWQSSCLQPAAAATVSYQLMAGCCSPAPISKRSVRATANGPERRSMDTSYSSWECFVLSSHKTTSDWVGVCTAACSRLLWSCGSDRGLKLPVWLFSGASH